ncbi:MAG: hypothetical protein ACYDH9_00230 [Limisphaerales bacterium]
MSFRYKSLQIAEIVKNPKTIREARVLTFRSYGNRGKVLDVDLDVKEGALLDLRLRVYAGWFDDPTTHEAALILADQRVRGVGYSATRQMRFYKERIPKGWHENVIDPNLPTRDDDCNRHETLSKFEPTDLDDFLRKVCKRWNIELPAGDKLL